ncbi:hypothetical protein FJZ53_05930 [Candidatus Woesearchaeota archaeon]|nr:hypothetical protein [Candidatus Woesearchaeota archaeon]
MGEGFEFKKSEEKTTELQCKKCKKWYSVPENPFQPGMPNIGTYKCPNCGTEMKVGGKSFFVGRVKEEEKK